MSEQTIPAGWNACPPTTDSDATHVLLSSGKIVEWPEPLNPDIDARRPVILGLHVFILRTLMIWVLFLLKFRW